MRRSRIGNVCLAAVVAAFCATWLLTACGNDSRILEITASSSVNNDAHEATISTTELIDGNALVGVVLTYPDGQTRMVMSGNYSGSGSGSITLDNLPSGDYSYKVYATPASPDDSPSVLTGKMVAEANVVTSGAFTIQ